MLARFLVPLALLALAACGGGTPADGAPDSPAREPLTQQQRDSIIGASALPGAGAVQRALDAANRISDRAARLDSLQR